MFGKQDLDERGELPAPFNVEKHNFNPHEVRGDFAHDRNGKAKVQKTAEGATEGFADKRGARVSSRGYRVDKHGNMIDNRDRKKVDATHMTPDGDLPKLFNYNGRRFDIVDTIGQLDKDALFYLRARGIPKKDAKALLTYAFANNVLESVNIPELKHKVKEIIAKKLGVSLGFDL